MTRTAIAIEARSAIDRVAGVARRAKARAEGIARNLYLHWSIYQGCKRTKKLRLSGYARPYLRQKAKR